MSTAGRKLPKEEISRRGEEIYERNIRPALTGDDHGKFVVIDVETGEYEIGSDEISVTTRIRERFPEAQTWLRRVGYDFVRRYGPRRREQK